MKKKNTIFTVAEVLSEPLANAEYFYATVKMQNNGYWLVEVQDECRSISWEVEIDLNQGIINAWKPSYQQTMPFVEALDKYFWPAVPRWSRIVRKLNKKK